MTEAEWLACEDPQQLMNAGPSSTRKQTLIVAGCLRHVAVAGLGRPAVRGGLSVEHAEALADLPPEEVPAWFASLGLPPPQTLEEVMATGRLLPQFDSFGFAWGTPADPEPAVDVWFGYRLGSPGLSLRCPRSVVCAVIRETHGNPFRRVTIDPAWLTSTVVALPRGIYEERAFDRLPILADALQDAGCENADILSHCRGRDLLHERGGGRAVRTRTSCLTAAGRGRMSAGAGSSICCWAKSEPGPAPHPVTRPSRWPTPTPPAVGRRQATRRRSRTPGRR